MAPTPKEAEVVYDAKGKRVCGSLDTSSGKPCMRQPDRGQLRCYRHAQARNEDGKAPTRGQSWTDARGRDASYIEKLNLGFDPEAADLQFEIELTTRHINALSVEYDDAFRELRRGGRDCRNPQAIRAELTAVLDVKRKLVTAHTQRLKLQESYLTMEEATVMAAVCAYLVSRLGLTEEQNARWVEEMKLCWRAPWKIKDLPTLKKYDSRDPLKRAERVVEALRQEGNADDPAPAAAETPNASRSLPCAR